MYSVRYVLSKRNQLRGMLRTSLMRQALFAKPKILFIGEPASRLGLEVIDGLNLSFHRCERTVLRAAQGR